MRKMQTMGFSGVLMLSLVFACSDESRSLDGATPADSMMDSGDHDGAVSDGALDHGGSVPDKGPGSETAPPPDAPAVSINGAWVQCPGKECTTFLNEGQQFATDGSWAVLLTAGGVSWNPGDSMCESANPDNRGTFTWDGTTVTATGGGGGAAKQWTTEITGDILTLVEVSGTPVPLFYKRIQGLTVTGLCP